MVAIEPTRLKANAISVRYGPTHALESVDFELRNGEVHAILGENGAGKSTLVKVISGAVQPTSGQMLLDGTVYTPQAPLEARLAGVSVIYQELSIVNHLTVAENINLGLEPQRFGMLDRRAMAERAHIALSKLGHAHLPLDIPAGTLTISEQQIVEIARSIALGCKVLILDEPTSSLGRADVSALFRLLGELSQDGYGIIYISHFLEEVQEIAHRFTIIRDGTAVTTGDARQTSVPDMITAMIGARMEDMYHRSSRTAGEPILELTDLTTEKLSSVELSLRKGEVFGIAGLLGSGRTELLRAIFGLDKVKTGALKLCHLSGWQTPAVRWRTGTGMLSEDRKSEGLALNMSIADNLVLSSLNTVSKGPLLSPVKKEEAAKRWVEKLSVKCAGPWAPMSTLSGGNQQKVAFARLLQGDADVLLLDEPTRGVDVKTKEQIYKLIDELASAGKAVLLVSSYLPELLGTCDRIAYMHRGKLSHPLETAGLSEEELMLLIVGAS